MSGEIPERVTCEVCGTSFDPRESRGWCPNEACGKWQHPAFPLSDGAAGRGAADGGVNAPTKVCPSCGKDVRADANFCKFCSHEFPDEPTQEPAGGDDPGLDACPDCGADLSSIPPDRLADCPICGTDLSGVLADQTEPDVTPADLTDCPACHADLTNIPADMRMVCPDCRVDLREAIQTHGVGDGGGGGGAGGAGGGGAQAGAEGGAEGQTSGQQAGGGAGGEASDDSAGGGLLDGTTDPDSGAAAESVDTIKGIGASYADRLAEAGVQTVGDLVRADLAELSAATDISEKRLGEWVERAPVDPADIGGVAGETDAAGGDQTGTAGGRAGGQQAGGGAGTGAQGGTGGHAGQGTQSGAGGQGTQGGAGGQAGAGGRASSGESTRASSGQGAGGSQGGSGGRQGGRNQPSVPGSSSGGQTGGQQGTGGQTGGQQGAGGTAGGRQGGRNQPSVPGASGGGQDSRAGQAQPHYNTVVFQVMGQEIRASPGDTIGREIRTAMVEGGAPDDDAVYVHREHLRVDQEGEAFYLVRLGQNSLKINGTPVGQHERAQVTNGDEVSFSEVVTADVRLE